MSNADEELTPQEICDRLNAYDEGRGYRGTNDWYIADVDYEVLSRKFFLLPASDRQYEGCSIFLDDARALIAGWKAAEELKARLAALTDQQPAEKECEPCGIAHATGSDAWTDRMRHTCGVTDPYSATAGFELMAERAQAVGTGVDLDAISERFNMGDSSDFDFATVLDECRRLQAELAALRARVGPAEMPKPPSKVLRYNRETGRIEADGISITPQEAEGEF